MAERNRRTGSRRTTPQPTSDRRDRATRSRSNDYSDLEELSGPSRPQRKHMDVSKSAKGQSKMKSGNAHTLGHNDLSIVTEEPSRTTTKPISRRSEAGEKGSGETGNIVDRKSLGGASAISGTTARASNSASELDELKSETLVDALSDIVPEADKILDLLVSGERWNTADHEAHVQNILEELDSKSSRTQKRLRRLSPRFSASLEEFGTNLFIDNPSVLRALFGSRLSHETAQEPWRPDPLFHKVNMASFALALYSPKDTVDDLELWKTIDSEFPGLFLNEQEVFDDDARRPTLDLAIEIRTQYFIRLVAKAANGRRQTVLDLVDQVFLAAGEPRGWNLTSLQIRQLDKAARAAIDDRITAISSLANSIEKTSNSEPLLEILRHQYPWKSFLSTAGQWLKIRVIEINYLIESHGGNAKVTEALNTEIMKDRADQPLNEGQSHANDRPADEVVEEVPARGQGNSTRTATENERARKAVRVKELKSVAFDPQSPKSNAMAAALFARTKKPTQAIATPQSAKAMRPQSVADAESSLQAQQRSQDQRPARTKRDGDLLQEEDIINESSGDEEESDQISPDIIEDIVRTSASQQAEGNKENEIHEVTKQPRHSGFRYNQAQNDAVREEFNDADLVNQPLRDVTPHQNRRSEVTDTTRKRPSPDNGSVHHSPAKRMRPAGAQREPNRRPQAAPAGLAEVTSSEVYREANLAAKARVASRGKPAQSRKPWSEEESGRLIDLIEQYGCGWAFLKEVDLRHPDGSLLEDRDQVAVKDKASNMKLDFLKAARNLPHPNWDNVSLRSSMIARLRDLGITYDKETGRREDADL